MDSARRLEVHGELTLKLGADRAAAVRAAGDTISIDFDDWTALRRFAECWRQQVRGDAGDFLVGLLRRGGLTVAALLRGRPVARLEAHGRGSWLGRLVGVPKLRFELARSLCALLGRHSRRRDS